MLGKKKCKILKEIRQKIADENDIPYVTRECRYQGDCRGTCPRCESELKYLEAQLAARAAAGRRIAVAALCAGMTFGIAGCSSTAAPKAPVEDEELSGAVEPEPSETGQEPETEQEPETGKEGSSEDEIIELSGDVEIPEENQVYETTGEVAPYEGTQENAAESASTVEQESAAK